MHSKIGPRAEATLLYIEQSRLRERLLGPSTAPLVLYDVGLGAGANALASIQHAQFMRENAQPRQHTRASAAHARVSGQPRREGAEGEFPVRCLHIVSFENDLSGFDLALKNSQTFPFFEGLQSAACALLNDGSWTSKDGAIRWELRYGDFLAQLDSAPRPELIFFDFYPPAVTPELWGVEVFSRIRRHAQHATLFTYSAATRVRAALLLAGFVVGYGRSTDAKLESTVASTALSELDRPLDARWLSRLMRSHDRVPHGITKSRETEILEQICDHPQFKRTSQTP